MRPLKILFSRIILVLMSYLLILEAQSVKAQPLFHPQSKPVLRMDGQNACWEPADLGLTEMQKKALKTLQLGCASEASALRMRFISLKLELRHLTWDRSIQPKILFDRQRRISTLRAKLDNLLLSCQIKTRSIFTREQLERLTSGFPTAMMPGSGIDWTTDAGPRGRFGR